MQFTQNASGVAPLSVKMLHSLDTGSATLQSMQWIINQRIFNAHYNQRLFTLLELTTK
jgi:hypothetical protein